PYTTLFRSRSAQVRGADYRGRRALRRLFVLDAAGGGELGQGQHRHRADGLCRSRLGPAATRQRRLPPRPLEDPPGTPLGQAVRLSEPSSEKGRRPERIRPPFSFGRGYAARDCRTNSPICVTVASKRPSASALRRNLTASTRI